MFIEQIAILGLGDEEAQRILKVVDKKYEPQLVTTAKLYFATEDGWTNTAMGAAAIVVDKSNSTYIQIIDLNSFRLIFSGEVKSNYEKMEEWFHTFPCNDGHVGLSFMTLDEATSFYEHVVKCTGWKKSPQLGAYGGKRENISNEGSLSSYVSNSSFESASSQPEMSISPKIASTTNVQPTIERKPNNIPAECNKEKDKELLKKLKSFIPKFQKKPKVVNISGPTEFKHISSVGFNPTGTNIEIKKLPAEFLKRNKEIQMRMATGKEPSQQVESKKVVEAEPQWHATNFNNPVIPSVIPKTDQTPQPWKPKLPERITPKSPTTHTNNEGTNPVRHRSNPENVDPSLCAVLERRRSAMTENNQSSDDEYG